MDHCDLSYPVLIWGEDYVFLARTIKDLEWIPRSQVDRLRQQARDGKVNLLDSKGMLFQVSDQIPISSPVPIISWLAGIKVAPALCEGRGLNLEEFKRQIKRAVRARQKGDYDSDFVGQLRDTLPLAASYREALDCLPKGM